MKKETMIQEIHDRFISEGGTEAEWNDKNAHTKQYLVSKNSYIRSVKSIEHFRKSSQPLIKFLKEDLQVTKFEKVERAHLEKYLCHRASLGLSAWTISSDLLTVNKLFGENITKAELHLPSRLHRNIVKGRHGPVAPNRVSLLEKHRDEITIAKATGIRRSSFSTISRSSFVFGDDGLPRSIRVTEKGGRYRESIVLFPYREEVLRIISEPERDNEPIFKNKLDSHLNIHYYRHEFACETIRMLAQEEARGEKYFRGELDIPIQISEHDLQRYPDGICGFSRESAYLTSIMMGHSRLEILRNYLY